MCRFPSFPARRRKRFLNLLLQIATFFPANRRFLSVNRPELNATVRIVTAAVRKTGLMRSRRTGDELMFTATGKIRNQRKAFGPGYTAMLIAVLVMANLVAIAGLGTTARAGDFPDALHYAPMSWEKATPETERTAIGPQAGTKSAAATTVTVDPVERAGIRPVSPDIRRDFVEISSEEPAPSTASIGRAGAHHRALLIALMSAALATMAGVSVLMFRSLAREITEAERKRRRF
jgi:hypothetical protein